jgi:surface antigen
MRSLAFVLVIVVVVAASGCETVTEHQKTAIGAGAGAAGGALLGGLISRNTTGVVVGGLLGGLVGGGIGYYLERQDRTRAEAVRQTGYTPEQGNVVRVERVQADPAELGPGGTVNLVATYTVLTPAGTTPQQVRETREVRHNGVLVANPTTEFSRAGGTFTSALPITLPATAGRGTYEVTTTIGLGDRLSRGMTTFTVK